MCGQNVHVTDHLEMSVWEAIGLKVGEVVAGSMAAGRQGRKWRVREEL